MPSPPCAARADGLEVLSRGGGAWKEYRVHRRRQGAAAWGGLSFQAVAGVVPLAIALVACWAVAGAVAWSRISEVQSESVVVIDGLGVQLGTSSSMGCRHGCLLETDRLKDVIIYEVISSTKVHTFLAFLLADTPSLVIAFKTLEPKLEMLQAVYRSLKADLSPAAHMSIADASKSGPAGG